MARVKKIELLVKPVSFDCNLNCKYCFYKGTGVMYPAFRHLMEKKVLEVMIKKAFEYSGGGLSSFSWQGGEPLLAGFNFFDEAVELQKKYGRTGQSVSNSIQTNGLLLGAEMTGLIKQYNIFMGLSLDGTEAEHNKYRGESFSGTMAAAERLRREKLEFNVLTVITGSNSKDPAGLYEFYLKNGFEYVQFIPCYETDKSGMPAPFSVEPRSYGDFLRGFFDAWHNGGNPKLGVRLFDNILEVLSGQAPGYCGFKDSCRDYLVVEHNGDVYPCDFFVKKEWRLGNILENSFEDLFEFQAASFSRLKAGTASKCKECEWLCICKGGCLKYRRKVNGGFDSPDHFCKAYKMFFRHSMEEFKRMAKNAR